MYVHVCAKVCTRVCMYLHVSKYVCMHLYIKKFNVHERKVIKKNFRIK